MDEMDCIDGLGFLISVLIGFFILVYWLLSQCIGQALGKLGAGYG